LGKENNGNKLGKEKDVFIWILPWDSVSSAPFFMNREDTSHLRVLCPASGEGQEILSRFLSLLQGKKSK
jgi:hypothetical protein